MKLTQRFTLDKEFVEAFKNKNPNFGFNGLGEITFYRTYSRLKEDGENEDWADCIERVVNTTYSIQKTHIKLSRLKWKEDKAQKSAQEMFTRIFEHKFHPPGRGFWAMTPELIEKVGGMALNNCAFISTTDLDKNSTYPFEFLMDVSMLGVGCGFDVKGAGKLKIIKPENKEVVYVIPDSREGWVKSLKLALLSFFDEKYSAISFDYSLIRPYGVPIKTFGGVASGHAPLKRLHESIIEVLTPLIGGTITETAIVDIMNMIGVCVVSGNVRRTAEISFGSSEEFMDLKNFDKNPKRNDWQTGWGWTSNNSIFAELGQDYSNVAERTRLNGEPGYEWLENAQNYGRMCENANYKDVKALGGNPCLEQTLESGEVCNLVETYPIHHDSTDDYLRTLKFAYLYAKTITLVSTHNEDTNDVMLRNRRIGLSQSGIIMYIEKFGLHKYKELCELGYEKIQYYDKVYSDWFKIPKSIKTTSIKPSGTVSLLAGVTPGMHYPENTTYIRRIRLAKSSKLLPKILNAGYFVEDVVNDLSGTTCVVEIPVKLEGIRKLSDVSMWEQVSLASFLQKYWADNQVSCTVTFKKEEGKDIERALNYFQYELKGISFLPKLEYGEYAQMPYEEITEEVYMERVKTLKPINFNELSFDSVVSKFCDNDSCEI